MEFRVVWPDSSVHWIDSKAKAFVDDDGTPLYITGACADVTSRKDAAEALRENEQRLRAIFNQAAVGIAVATLDGHFVRVNKKFSDIMGYSPDQLRDLTISAITHPDDLADTLAAVRRLLNGSHSEYALEKRSLAHLQTEDVGKELPTEHLVVAPILTSGDLLLGVPRRNAKGEYFNSVLSLGLSPGAAYDKAHLVPFGEFVPPGFGAIVREWLHIPMADFSSGTSQPKPIAAAGQKIAVNICYEDAYGVEILRQLPDATLLVNVSNVAWFGDSLAPGQHLQMARLRAIETGRMHLTATNTGIARRSAPMAQCSRACHSSASRLDTWRRAAAARRPIAIADGWRSRSAAARVLRLARAQPLKSRAPCSASSSSSSDSTISGTSAAARCCSPTTWKWARAPSTPRLSCVRSVPSPGTRPMCSPRAGRRTGATATTRCGCSTTTSIRSP
jgi:PAS domain S-box-containing protein